MRQSSHSGLGSQFRSHNTHRPLIHVSIGWCCRPARLQNQSFQQQLGHILNVVKPAMSENRAQSTCLDMILILELLLSMFTAMATRLERTEVTLCGSNTEPFQRGFAFLRFPHALHKLSPWLWCFFRCAVIKTTTRSPTYH